MCLLRCKMLTPCVFQSEALCSFTGEHRMIRCFQHLRVVWFTVNAGNFRLVCPGSILKHTVWQLCFIFTFPSFPALLWTDHLTNSVKRNWSHFILGGLNYYVLKYKNKYSVLIAFIFYWKTLVLLLRCDTGTVRDRFGGMVGLRVG